jgi:hypothetical protein
MKMKKYHVTGYPGKSTDSPYDAIRTWYRLEPKDRTCCAILAYTWADAKELLEFAQRNKRFIHLMHQEYKSSYKEDWILESIDKALEDDGRYFIEGPYDFCMDSIHPFCCG